MMPGSLNIYHLIPVALLVALWRPTLGRRLFHEIGRILCRVAQKPWRGPALCAAASLLLSLGTGLVGGLPVPHTHDEFGYLLMGDTFAAGRITNPPHPMWEFFESIHIIHHPTYTSKYPPGQGVALAVGQVLFGHPIYGVWITTALACAAVCWMLLAWMPNRWALVGGLITVFHSQTLAWSQSYWGGAVAMGGGAILLGAFRRLVRQPRVRDAVWLGGAMFILANSRPYEGFVMSLLVFAALCFILLSRQVPLSALWRQIIFPLSLISVVTLTVVGCYNRAVTGSPLRMPYVVHEETYGIAPLFVFGKPKQQTYLHKELREFHEWCLRTHQAQQGCWAFVRAVWNKLSKIAKAYSWSCLLFVPLLGLPWAIRRDRWLIFAVFIGLAFIATSLLATWVLPHYSAPVAGLFILLVVQSLRHVRIWWRTRGRRGLAVTRSIYTLAFLSVGLTTWKLCQHDPSLWYHQRHKIEEELLSKPGRHLVIVRYGPRHNPHREWVYNGADLDHARILWARDMGAKRTQELLAYYKDRTVWTVDADASSVQLNAYHREGCLR